MSQVIDDSVEAGREAAARHAWRDAYELLRPAAASLGPEDLERLADAARWSRHYTAMVDAFERAQAGFARSGDRRGAARAALQLAWEHYTRGDDAVSTGWFGQAAACSSATLNAGSTRSF
jgi:hypothetical protein